MPEASPVPDNEWASIGKWLELQSYLSIHLSHGDLSWIKTMALVLPALPPNPET